MRAANVGWNGLILDDIKQMNFTDDEMAVYRLKPGDLLLNEASGSAAEVGKPAIWMGEIDDCAFQNTLLRVRPGPSVDPRYLLHYLRTQALNGAFARGSRGVGIHHLGREALARWPLPLPPLGEQRRIAAILDHADLLRRARYKVIADVSELSRSAFLERFGNHRHDGRSWPLCALGELIKIGPQNGLYKPGTAYGSGCPIVRIDSFGAGLPIRFEALKRIRVSPAEVELYGLAVGDVVVNRVNSPEHLGKATVIGRLTEPTIFESNMMRLTLDTDRILPEYLVTYLDTPSGKGQIRRASKDAVNQSSINQTDVRNFSVPLPPIEMQGEYVRQQELSSTLLARYARSRLHLDALFASLQSRAFKGQL